MSVFLYSHTTINTETTKGRYVGISPQPASKQSILQHTPAWYPLIEFNTDTIYLKRVLNLTGWVGSQSPKLSPFPFWISATSPRLFLPVLLTDQSYIGFDYLLEWITDFRETKVSSLF